MTAGLARSITASRASDRLAERVVTALPQQGGLPQMTRQTRSGTARGNLHDAIPFVGLAKNAVELFTGDFIPDKKAAK